MNLPTDFQFSQSSLQDFETCARQFELRYLDKLRWPAIEAEPVQEAERLARLGTDFHRLVQQHLVGLDIDTLTATLDDSEADLQNWWQNYLNHRPDALAGATIYPELTLSTPLQGYRLLARFDVLVIQADGSFLIIDWKTTHKKPSHRALGQRMQSRIYPYVLVTAGTAFNNGQPIEPKAIKMLYWYPQFPDQPELFNYSRKKLKQDEQFLSELIERVKDAAHHDNFPLVDNQKPCATCVYRSLCDRGREAGSLTDLAEETDEEFDLLALDWDQIAEIQF